MSYDTTAEQLHRLPDLIRSVVDGEALVELQSCRFMTIGAFSYDIVIRLHASHPSFAAFKNAIHQLNQALLIALAAAQIEIPFPTQLQLQRDA